MHGSLQTVKNIWTASVRNCHTEATSGFSFHTVTQDPAIRKAVDDIVFDLYGEENPCREEDYNLAPSEEMQMGGM